LISYYRRKAAQLEEQLGKIRGFMADEEASGSSDKAKSLGENARLCQIELNNYQREVDRINDKQ
jgi:hypothetical protein